MGLSRRTSGFLAALLAASAAGAIADHVVADPEARTRCLAVLMQGVRSLEESVTSGELGQVHNEDMLVSAALTVLVEEARSSQKEDLTMALLAFGRSVAELHTAADAFDRDQATSRLGPVSKRFAEITGAYDAERLAAARVLADRFTCAMHREVIGRRHDRCPKCGMPLESPARILPFTGRGTPASRTIAASIRTEGPLGPDREVRGILSLSTPSGDPVLLTDLREVHTRKIHLLVIDNSLTDYHHEHPVPTGAPGEYRFSFTAGKPGPYRAWADVQPLLTGFQEYAIADMNLPGVSEPTTPAYTTTAELESLRYRLVIDGDWITAGTPARARVRVTTLEDKPFVALEPLMGAFAHLVGFHQDHQTVVHMHPLQSAALEPEDRGGPDLEFQIYVDKPGFYRLFLQVQVEGKSKFVPFGIRVRRP
jgi:hypothetical protein